MQTLKTASLIEESARPSVRRRVVVGVALAAALAIALVTVLVAFRGRGPHALVAQTDVKTVNVHGALKIGGVGYLGFGILGARGKEPIHIVSAEVLDVPDGMKIEGLYFVSVRAVRNAPLGYDISVRPYLRPVDSVTFDRPSEEKSWTLMAGVYATRAGKFRSKGLRVCYTVGGQRDCETYLNKIIGIDINPDPHKRVLPYGTPLPSPWPGNREGSS